MVILSLNNGRTDLSVLCIRAYRSLRDDLSAISQFVHDEKIATTVDLISTDDNAGWTKKIRIQNRYLCRKFSCMDHTVIC